MKIHEYQATQLFKNAGVSVVSGEVSTTVDEALKIAEKTGYPVVLKSQVLVGGRGKAGGIKVVKTKEELAEKFKELRALVIKGYPVEKILVVKAINIKKEFYVAVAVDGANNDVVLIASAAGGVDIEETAKTNPSAIKKFYLGGKKELDAVRWPEFISSVFDDVALQEKGTKVFQSLVDVFFNKDCSLAEINPLVIDDTGEMYAADAKINFDDNALFRHEEIAAMRDLRYEDADELEAKEKNLSFVKLEGNVGCVVNGAGLAMATMDIIKLLGGQPANFLDVGGSSNPEKVLNALNIILRNKEVNSILINIFGGITRCDDIAKGLVEALNQMDISVPIVIRLTGTNEKEAKEFLSQHNIQTFSSMREAVQKVVEASKQGK